MKKTIGETIASLRIQAGISQNQLAKEIGRTQKSIKNIEDDNCEPSVETIILLAKYFHVSSDYILGISDKYILNLSMLNEKERGIIHCLVQQFIKYFHGK